MSDKIFRAAAIPERSGRHIFYRVVKRDIDSTDQTVGALAARSEIKDPIRVEIWNVDTRVRAAQELVTVAKFILDTPVTINGVSYNARYDTKASHFTSGGSRYRVEVKVTPVQGEPHFLTPVEFDVVDMFGS